MIDRSPLLGFLLAALSSLLGGTAVVVTRLLVAGIQPPVEPLAVVSLRYAIGAACLAAIAAPGALRVLRSPDAPAALALGVWFYAFFPFLFTLALAHTTAGRGALALTTMPVLTLAGALLAGVERFRWVRVAGIALALIGVAAALHRALAVGGQPDAWRGDLIMVAATAAVALYNVVSRPYLRRHPSLAMTSLGMTVGAIVLAATATATVGWSSLAAAPASFWPAMLYLGVVGCAAPFWLWSAALERTQPTSVAVTVALNPVSAMLLGAWLLGEPVPLALVLGLVTVLAGIVLANWPERRSS
jgi:drug/metabolite transporter (DMT)-like permease